MSVLIARVFSTLRKPIYSPLISWSESNHLYNIYSGSWLTTYAYSRSQFPQGANDSRDLAARINNDVLPSVTEVVDFYKNFADRQVASLSETPTKSTLEQLSRENAALAAQGNTKAKAAQVVVLDFKNRSVLVNNAVRFDHRVDW